MGRVAGSGKGREPYWRLVLARWKQGGLSVRAFCLAEGVSAPSFYWWRRELQRRDQPKPAFLPVHVLADKAESPAGSIEVVLANGRCLRVGAGFDPQTLVQVVERAGRPWPGTFDWALQVVWRSQPFEL